MEQSDLRAKVAILVGKSSMCWNPIPTGVFNDSMAIEVIDEFMELIEKELKDKGAIF